MERKEGRTEEDYLTHTHTLDESFSPPKSIQFIHVGVSTDSSQCEYILWIQSKNLDFKVIFSWKKCLQRNHKYSICIL